MFLAVVLSFGSGCVSRPEPAVPPPSESPAVPDWLARPVEGDLVRIDWNGHGLTEVVNGVALHTGRVLVYDRRQVEQKPPVNFSRVVNVPSSGVYTLLESVLAFNELACAQVFIRRPAAPSVTLTRLVRRPEASKGSTPFLLEDTANDWSRLDLPFMVVAGPESQAHAVRRALVELLQVEDHPVATPDPARDAHAALPPFSSPYPRCAR